MNDCHLDVSHVSNSDSDVSFVLCSIVITMCCGKRDRGDRWPSSCVSTFFSALPPGVRRWLRSLIVAAT